MKDYFLVTGLPRSRTAWLANFFTFGDSVCLHDPLPAFKMDVLRVVQHARSLPFGNVGISDPAIAQAAMLYHLAFPDARVLIVNRDYEDSIRSFAKAFNLAEFQAAQGVDRCVEGLDLIRSKFKHILEVDYDELSHPATLERLFKFCCPKERFSETRVNILTKIRCTVVI